MTGILDYGAGNIRSVENAVRHLGFPALVIERPDQILTCERLIFPGVGNFGSVIASLRARGFVEPLLRYLADDRPFLGICIGLQTLFEESEESPGVAGLGVLKGRVRRFPAGSVSVPHIGWNGVRLVRPSRLFASCAQEKFYFDHAYFVEAQPPDDAAVCALTDYGRAFVSAVEKGNLWAVQFHPEKSGEAGLSLLRAFLSGDAREARPSASCAATRLAKRIIACLDVRQDDTGRIVVTKGDRYDVRDAGRVRDLGDPAELARRYYQEGADEIVFLNITGFRQETLSDLPMLDLLRRTSEQVFVPLTIGGGIRPYRDRTGAVHSGLDVAAAYFRAGADKVSLGSQAVEEVEAFLARGQVAGSSIREISERYGSQAVVVSVDPRRVYVSGPGATHHHVVKLPDGRYCWYQCTVKGGREGRDLDAYHLCCACADLGAGEILLNSIDADGQATGFDIALLSDISQAVSIPIIASSGAGCPAHFVEVFSRTDVEAALAAGIFHRRRVSIAEIKEALRREGIETR